MREFAIACSVFFIIGFAFILAKIHNHQDEYESHNPEQQLCNKHFKTSWRSITVVEAKDIHHKGRKPNTVTIICEEE